MHYNKCHVRPRQLTVVNIMKPIVFLIMAFAYGTIAKGQLKLNILKCNYDGKHLNLKAEIINADSMVNNVYLNSSLDIVQMPYNPNGDELSKRLNFQIPNTFILSYANDTLIKDFKFYTLGIPNFITMTIPPKNSVIREYQVSVIGPITEKLLLERSNSLEIEFYLVCKVNGLKYYVKSNRKGISYDY